MQRDTAGGLELPVLGGTRSRRREHRHQRVPGSAREICGSPGELQERIEEEELEDREAHIRRGPGYECEERSLELVSSKHREHEIKSREILDDVETEAELRNADGDDPGMLSAATATHPSMKMPMPEREIESPPSRTLISATSRMTPSTTRPAVANGNEGPRSTYNCTGRMGRRKTAAMTACARRSVVRDGDRAQHGDEARGQRGTDSDDRAADESCRSHETDGGRAGRRDWWARRGRMSCCLGAVEPVRPHASQQSGKVGIDSQDHRHERERSEAEGDHGRARRESHARPVMTHGTNTRLAKSRRSDSRKAAPGALCP